MPKLSMPGTPLDQAVVKRLPNFAATIGQRVVLLTAIPTYRKGMTLVVPAEAVVDDTTEPKGDPCQS